MAAIHISALSNRMSPAEEAELLAAARGAAVQVERDLGRMHGDTCAAGLRAPGSPGADRTHIASRQRRAQLDV
ncbi:hypothetical protein [Pseudonocardia sp. DLS-67]